MYFQLALLINDEKIEFTAGTMQSFLSSVAELRVSTKDEKVKKIKNSEKAVLLIRYIHPKYLELDREIKFLNNIYTVEKAQSSETTSYLSFIKTMSYLSSIKTTIDNLKKERDTYKDVPRILFEGEVAGVNMSDDPSVSNFTISMVADAVYYKKYKVSLFLTTTPNNVKRMNELMFYGYPILFSAEIEFLKSILGKDSGDGVISGISRFLESLEKLSIDADSLDKDDSAFIKSYYDDKQVSTALKKFVEKKMKNFMSMPFNYKGNKMNNFFKGNISELFKRMSNQEPDIFAIWAVILDMFGYELVFLPNKVKKNLYSNLARKIFPELEKIKINSEGEKEDGNNFILKTIYDDIQPSFHNSVFPDSVSNLSYFKNFYKEYTRFLINMSVDSSNESTPIESCFASIEINEDEKMKIELINFRKESQRMYQTSQEFADSTKNANKGIVNKIKVSEIEKKRGVIPLERTFNMYDALKIVEEKKEKVEGYSFLEHGIQLLALNTVYDGTYGMRNSNASLSFEPSLIAGLPGVFSKLNDSGELEVYYGKINSVTHTFSPESIESSAQLEKVITGKESILSIYETSASEDDFSKNDLKNMLSLENVSSETDIKEDNPEIKGYTSANGTLKFVNAETIKTHIGSIYSKYEAEDLMVLKLAHLPIFYTTDETIKNIFPI